MINKRVELMEVIDNKEVGHAVNNPESGCACNTCVYFYLPLPEDADPTRTFQDFTTEELPLVVKTVLPVGCCSVLVPHNRLIANVPANYNCHRFVERPFSQQFHDDRIDE